MLFVEHPRLHIVCQIDLSTVTLVEVEHYIHVTATKHFSLTALINTGYFIHPMNINIKLSDIIGPFLFSCLRNL